MPNYLYDLSARFHHFYTKNRVVTEDIKKSQALLSLVGATRQTLANGLALIGVSAPERM
jgi:arginyl-tRNA synthetase